MGRLDGFRGGEAPPSGSSVQEPWKLFMNIIVLLGQTDDRALRHHLDLLLLKSNLIAAIAFMEPVKEWMLIDRDGVQARPVENDSLRRFRPLVSLVLGLASLQYYKKLHSHPYR
ncbi:hypothetical protein H5410_002913 [Solanum commersonii]|uniref:Uncharacterized protein n=1 Tax=Solanum commersonii TaxID=4109 RepID=A0A9J6B3I1_SOLCO|nr:hypothetical protein H5410_002913 [Solanum commersonii]